MPLTLFDSALARCFGAETSAHLHAWLYRVGIYMALHVLDEPAWLALMFC